MRPNLSLYNKQWGEQWSGRRQVRCALISETVAGWAGFSSHDSPASLALANFFCCRRGCFYNRSQSWLENSPGHDVSECAYSPVRAKKVRWHEFLPWRRGRSAEQNHGSKRYAERLITHINIALVCHHTGSRGGRYYHLGPDVFTWKHSEHLYLLCI